MRRFTTFHICLLSVSLVAMLAFGASRVTGQSATAPQYTPTGDLIAPTDYKTWVFVGSNLGLAYKTNMQMMTRREAARAEKPQFHNIYIKPDAYAHFLQNKQFPDQTVLVMEKFEAQRRDTKGVLKAGMFNGNRAGLEVAVKNSKRPDGKTTPWAYYDMTDKSDPSKIAASAPAFPDEACQNCHKAHASFDNVWVQFYPVLRGLLP
jgi:hypothetical protein